MKIDGTQHHYIIRLFALVNHGPAGAAFPHPAALSQALIAAMPPQSGRPITSKSAQVIAKMFPTASVNMWLRSVHSFLVSASLTGVSPIWASTVGYYSSHYAVRAIAHMLGFFQLFARKRIARLELQNGQFICTVDPKAQHDREHTYYWKIVKRNSLFASDPFFTDNDSGADESDVAHRDRASYADHLPQFPVFHPLDGSALRERVDRISEIEFNVPPIPKVSRYPDLESVQIVAYHRIIRFRELLDTALGDTNRFWNVHRNPSWAREFMDFQLTEEASLRSEFTL